MKTIQMRINKGYLLKACYKESQLPSLVSDTSSKAERKLGELHIGKKEEHQVCHDRKMLSWGLWRWAI